MNDQELAAEKQKLDELGKRIANSRDRYLGEPGEARGPRRSHRPRRRWTHRQKLVLRAFLVVFAIGFLLEGIEWLQGRRDERRAAEWQESAEAALWDGWSLEDGRRWLEENGFDVVWWNPHHERGWSAHSESAAGVSTIVAGTKPLHRSTLLFDDAWIWLYFEYPLDGEPGASARVWPFAPPGARADRGR